MGLILVSVLVIILSAILILAVLLQPGKGDMLTSTSGLTNQFSSVLGAKKTMDMLSKVTIGIAITIFLLSVVTNKFLLNNGPANIQKTATEGMQMPTNSAPISTPVAPPANGGGKK